MKDYPRCRTCAHYRPTEPSAEYVGYGTWDDDGETFRPHYPGWCAKMQGPADADDPTTLPESGRMAITVDGSTYKADLLVTPDFGCILHSDITP